MLWVNGKNVHLWEFIRVAISEELPFSLHTRHKHLAFGRIRCYVVEYENRNVVNEHLEILHLICKLHRKTGMAYNLKTCSTHIIYI